MAKAKKITLSELDNNDKKKLTRVSVLSLLIALLLCAVIVSCFSCSYDYGSQKMTAEQEALYWKSLLPNTDWTVSTDESNNGVLEGQSAALNVQVRYESTTDKFTIYFVTTDTAAAQVLSGNLELLSSKASITLENDNKVWEAKFSEKNDKLYLTITDSGKSKVYYYRNK